MIHSYYSRLLKNSILFFAAAAQTEVCATFQRLAERKCHGLWSVTEFFSSLISVTVTDF